VGGVRARSRGQRSRSKSNRQRRSTRGGARALFLLLVGGFALLAGYGPVKLPDSVLDPVREIASDEAWVDPGGLSFDSLPRWADSRWIDSLEGAALDCDPFVIGDESALADLGQTLLAFPFVERIDELRASRREGLSVGIALRRPVACIPVGQHFLLVARDAVVLPGRWDTPPRCESGFLPVIGPEGDAELFLHALPGDWLVDPAHLAAIDVACSMIEHLDELARNRLGRTRIDAGMAAAASVLEPGVMIYLENKRLCLFGRAPSTSEPGELPVHMKWAALADALALLEQDPPVEWEHVDCRWDRPDLRLGRMPEIAAAAVPRSTPHSNSTPNRGAMPRRGTPQPRTSGPRVR